MGFQDKFPTPMAEPKCLLTLKGQSLIGAKVQAPTSPYEYVYMLPLTTISMTKGTAIVTSVPSDSPDGEKRARQRMPHIAPRTMQAARAHRGCADATKESTDTTLRT